MRFIQIITMLFLSGVTLFSCSPSASEIDKVYDEVVTHDYKFVDTVITYDLYHDSLVLHMNDESLFDQWYFEIEFDDTTNSTTYDHVVNKKAFMVENSRVVIDSIQLDNPEHTIVRLFGHLGGGKRLVFNNGELALGVKYVMEEKGKLKAFDYWSNESLKLQIINESALDGHPKPVKDAVTKRFLEKVSGG